MITVETYTEEEDTTALDEAAAELELDEVLRQDELSLAAIVT